MKPTLKTFLLFSWLTTTSCTLNITVSRKASEHTPLTILDVLPKETFFLGGEKIRIKGAGFEKDVRVQIGNSNCLDVKVISVEELECTAPKFDSELHGFASGTPDASNSSKKLDISIQSVTGPKAILSETFQYKSDTFSRVELFSGTLSHAGRSNAVGTDARFSLPSSIFVHDNYLYIADSANHLIRRAHLQSLQTEDFVGSYRQPGSTNGIGASAQFHHPMGMTISGDYLYVADNGTCIIRKVNLITKEVSTFAGQPGVCGAGHNHAVGTSASFGHVTGLANDGNYIYVADDSSSVRKISLTGTHAVSYAHTNANSFGTVVDVVYLNNALFLTSFLTASDFYLEKIDLMTGTESTLFQTVSRIGGLTTDGQSLFVSLTIGRKIQRVDLNSPSLTDFVGSGVAGNSDGVGIAAKLSAPSGLHFYNNDVYFTSFGSHNVRKFNINTLEVKTILGNNK